ncbi:MAG TPA: hypothetical protein VMW52_02290, partial [Phycisphaerae bacterium]|nr:hypothetical protein [Phycisphaerae bacterium]
MNRHAVPQLTCHKPSGLARVRIHGRDHYLGPYGSTEATAAYHRTVAQWLATHVSLADDEQLESIAELVAARLAHVKAREAVMGRPTSRFAVARRSMSYLLALYPDLPPEQFGPRKLIAVRQRMIADGLARRTIAEYVANVRNAFAWGCANELIPPAVYHGLLAVKGLTVLDGGRETEPVEPVPWDRVAAVRRHV